MTLDTLVGRSLDHIKCTEGEVEVRGLNIHYWRYESTKATKTLPPVFGLHGGPAATHNYIRPLLLLADEGHPVIFYDQAGCGASQKGKASSGVKNPKKDAPWLLTIEYYVEELHAMVNHFGLSDKGYYVYGSSWGTVLAQEFAITIPTGLRGLILDGALCDG